MWQLGQVDIAQRHKAVANAVQQRRAHAQVLFDGVAEVADGDAGHGGHPVEVDCIASIGIHAGNPARAGRHKSSDLCRMFAVAPAHRPVSSWVPQGLARYHPEGSLPEIEHEFQYRMRART